MKLPVVAFVQQATHTLPLRQQLQDQIPYPLGNIYQRLGANNGSDSDDRLDTLHSALYFISSAIIFPLNST